MANGQPIFNQVASLALYSLSSSGDSGVAGYWAGYLPSPSAQFGPSITLSQAWLDVGGVYLFLAQTPASPAIFLQNLIQLLPRLSPTGAVRVIWLANPNDSPGYWQIQTLQAVSGAPGTWTVFRQAIFPLGGYSVLVLAGAALTQAGSGSLGYGIAADSAHVMFLTPGNGYTAVSGSAGIPFSGLPVGAWIATLSLPGSSGSPDGFSLLGVQLCYTMPASSDPADNRVQAVPMPVLCQGAANVTLYLSFDPLNLLIANRSGLGFFPPGGAGSAPSLGGAFVTPLGYGTRLTPLVAAAPLWNARLVFCASPMFLTAGFGDSYYNYYLAPDGAFTLTTLTPGPALQAADRVTLGLSALEYVGMPPQNSAIALFQASQPAHAPNARVGATGGESLDAALLIGLATTAYVTFLPPSAAASGLTYFAQPRQAPLYVAGDTDSAGFMDFHEMPAATLPSWGSGQTTIATLPVGVYTGLDPSLAPFARAIEEAALAPARRMAVGLPAALAAAEDAPPPLAVTPQGLVAILTSDQTQWAGVMLANLADAPQLSFAPVGAAFQAALQSNQLFFVVSNVDTFMGQTSVGYRLTPASLQLLPAVGVPQAVVDALNALLGGMTPPYPAFATEAAFTQAIQATAGTYIDQILPLAGQLRISLDGWVFQLSPRSWRIDPDHPTMMIFKYCNRTLESVVADGSAWGWPQAAQDASGDLKPTQKRIQNIFQAAAQADANTPYARFYREVVANPFWNGVLFLNAPVAIQELPPELQFATAGIDGGRFYGHHVGCSLTPFDAAGGTILLGQTAVFGLIDYQDPVDLYLSATVPFAFKTLAFTARFANSMLAEFAARVELMVNRLFGSEMAKSVTRHGNNLILDGSYQRQNDVPSYAFVLEGNNAYSAQRAALESVEVLGVQIQTATSTQSAGPVSADFVLSGNLRFHELPRFDLFSYGREEFTPAGQQPQDGYLRFNNLVVTMAYSLAPLVTQTFKVSEGRMSFDLGNSVARPLSLAQNFPVTVGSLIASPNVAAAGAPAEGQRPEDLGYTSIFAPIDQSLLSPPWYGLVLQLDLGTLGALAGSVGLSATLVAAWAPGTGEGQPPVFLGLQLPDAKSAGLNLPIQGVLRLGFRSFQFEANDSGTRRNYMLRLRRLALSILGWSFPPGNTDVFLFGNDRGDPKAAMGWYAAYSAADGSGPKSPATPARRLRSGRRIAPPAAGS